MQHSKDPAERDLDSLPDWGRDLHMNLGVEERQRLGELWRDGWAHWSDDYAGFDEVPREQ